MEKFWMVYSHKNDGKLERFNSRKEVQERAVWKAHQSMDREHFYVLESVVVCQRPLPTDVHITHIRDAQ
jgi:hypothetical protein